MRIRMKHFKVAVLSALVGLAAGTLNGQEEENDSQPLVTQSMTVIASDDGAPPMIFSSSPGTMAFGDGIGFNVIGGEGTFSMPAPDPYSLINDPSVQKDLELVGDQLDKVRELQSRQNEEIREQMGLMKEGGKIELSNLDGLKETIQKLRNQHRDELNDMLLPHQIERLRQVALQTHMRRSGTAGALASSQLAEELGIDEEQIKKLKEKSKALNEAFQEKIAEWKEQMKQELLQELTPQQRQKLESMMGDKFEPKREDWRESNRQRRLTRPGRIRSSSSSDSSRSSDSEDRSGGR